ncbi:MAG: polysaccharide deacetylase family protein [Candidatus Acidiferrales bacterium]
MPIVNHLKMSARPRCTTSWDDGHPLDRRVADLLAKYDLTGTFYVPMETGRSMMTRAQVRELSDAFEVGAHTVHHVVLTDVRDHTAETEIRQSKQQLEEWTGRSCDAFCFPKGRFRRRHLDMVQRAGFRSARTVELLSTRFPQATAGIYLIPTTVQACPYPWTTYAKNSLKRLTLASLVSLVVHVRSTNWVETAHSILRVVARRGGVFHLWGHSWEIDEQQQWPQLEVIFREMQALSSTIACVPNSLLVPTADSAPVLSEVQGTSREPGLPQP